MSKGQPFLLSLKSPRIGKSTLEALVALEQGEGLGASRDPLPSILGGRYMVPITEAEQNGKEVIPLEEI